MSARMRILTRGCCALIWLLPWMSGESSPALGAEPDVRPVLIHVRTVQIVHQPVLRVGDVADLTEGSAWWRDEISRLDLAELGADQPAEVITRTRILARLAVAGIPTGRYQVSGAENTFVAFQPQRSPEQALLSALQDSFATRLGVPADDVQVRLHGHLPQQFVDAISPESGRQPEITIPTSAGIGNLSVIVKVPPRDGGRTLSASLAIAVELRQPVLVAQRPVAAGAPLTSADIAAEERFLPQAAEPLSAADVVDRRARRSIAPGEVLSSLILAEGRPSSTQPLIRPRDQVNVVARTQTLNLTLSAAEALQPGSVGDMIRVRNPSSGKVFVGRVVSAKVVEVPL